MVSIKLFIVLLIVGAIVGKSIGSSTQVESDENRTIAPISDEDKIFMTNFDQNVEAMFKRRQHDKAEDIMKELLELSTKLVHLELRAIVIANKQMQLNGLIRSPNFN